MAKQAEKKYFVAVAPLGKEYMYNKGTAHKVSKASKEKICEILNDSKFRINDNQAWHIYELEQYDRDFTSAGYYGFTIRNGYLYETIDNRL